MAIEPLESITRICLARQLSAATWLRLIKEAKAKAATDTDVSDTSVDLLYTQAIDTVLPLISTSGTASAQSYLQACLVADIPKEYLLKKLLDEETASIPLDRSGVQHNVFLECIAATLLSSDPALATKMQSSTSTPEATTSLKTCIRLLSLAAQGQLSSLFLLTLQLLQMPLPEPGHSKEPLRQSICSEITACRNTLLSITNAAASLPAPFELALKLLSKLQRKFDPVSYRKNTFIPPPTFPSIPTEIEILLQTTLYRNGEDALPALVGSFAVRLAVSRAIGGQDGAVPHQDLLGDWLADIFQCCSRHASLIDEPKSRTEARWRALAFGRLPALIREVQRDSSMVREGFDWAAAVEHGLQKCKDRSEQTGMGDLSNWIKGMKEYLSITQKEPSPSSYSSPELLLSLLEEGLNDYAKQASAAGCFERQLATWVAAPDLPALHHFLLSLVKETPRIVDFVLLHTNSEALFKPVCCLLDIWDSSEEYGAGQAMELYGGLLLALRTLVHRHHLHESFAKFEYSVAPALTATSRSLGKIYSLHALSSQHQKLVSSWITALYGSEGIEDDLIRSTPPRTMLLLAPTIVHQSVVAMEAGIIDQDTLLNGLSYFCQDFLTFTLPGIISYLANGPRPNIQLIKPLLTSDTTPNCVLELVQDDLQEMLPRLDPADEDVKFLHKRVKAGWAAVTLDGTSLTVALGSGIEVIQNILAVSETAGPTAAIRAALQVQDLVTASLLASMSLKSYGGKAILLEYLNGELSRLEIVNEDARASEVDRLADFVALVQIRSGFRMDEEAHYPISCMSFRRRELTWLPDPRV